MIATVVVTVVTHDLAKGVVMGVLLSAVFFMRKVGKMLTIEMTQVDARQASMWSRDRCSSPPLASS